MSRLLPLLIYVLNTYRTIIPSMYRGHFSPNNSREKAKARPLGRDMIVFRELEVWLKLCPRSCTLCNIVLFSTAICRQSIELGCHTSNHAYLVCVTELPSNKFDLRFRYSSENTI